MPNKPVNLAKVAAVSAVVFVVSLGICGYSAKHYPQEFGGDVGFFSLLGMLLSFAVLIAAGLTGIIRIVKRRY